MALKSERRKVVDRYHERMVEAGHGGTRAETERALLSADPLDLLVIIEALSERVRAVEARPVGLSYAGVWRAGEAYAKHTGVTHDGSVWVARTDYPSGEPGTPDSGWQLAVKRGSDGRRR